MVPSLRVVLTVTLLLIGFRAHAAPQIDSELVSGGILAYDNLDYERAIQLMEKALKSESLTRNEKLAAYRVLACSHVGIGKPDLAKREFATVLRLDPQFTLDRTVSPRIRSVFEEARSAFARQDPSGNPTMLLPALRPMIAPAKAKEGQAVTVAVSYPGGAARRVKLFYRTKGKAAYSEQQREGGLDGQFTLTVPGLQVQPPALEYYLVALDEGGSAIAEGGTLAKPFAAEVEAKRLPAYKKGWFWGVVGAVLAAGTVAAAVGATVALTREEPKTGVVVFMAH